MAKFYVGLLPKGTQFPTVRPTTVLLYTSTNLLQLPNIVT
jgi:hypothetical protein